MKTAIYDREILIYALGKLKTEAIHITRKLDKDMLYAKNPQLYNKIRWQVTDILNKISDICLVLKGYMS